MNQLISNLIINVVTNLFQVKINQIILWLAFWNSILARRFYQSIDIDNKIFPNIHSIIYFYFHFSMRLQSFKRAVGNVLWRNLHLNPEEENLAWNVLFEGFNSFSLKNEFLHYNVSYFLSKVLKVWQFFVCDDINCYHLLVFSNP